MNNNDQLDDIELFSELNNWINKKPIQNKKLFILLINELNRTSIITQHDTSICGFNLYQELQTNRHLQDYLNLILSFQGLKVIKHLTTYELVSNIYDLQSDDEDDDDFNKYTNWFANRNVKFSTKDGSLQIYLAMHSYYAKHRDSSTDTNNIPNNQVIVSIKDFQNYLIDLFNNTDNEPKFSKTQIDKLARYKMNSKVKQLTIDNQKQDGFIIYDTINRTFTDLNQLDRLKNILIKTNLKEDDSNE